MTKFFSHLAVHICCNEQEKGDHFTISNHILQHPKPKRTAKMVIDPGTYGDPRAPPSPEGPRGQRRSGRLRVVWDPWHTAKKRSSWPLRPKVRCRCWWPCSATAAIGRGKRPPWLWAHWPRTISRSLKQSRRVAAGSPWRLWLRIPETVRWWSWGGIMLRMFWSCCLNLVGHVSHAQTRSKWWRPWSLAPAMSNAKPRSSWGSGRPHQMRNELRFAKRVDVKDWWL